MFHLRWTMAGDCDCAPLGQDHRVVCELQHGLAIVDGNPGDHHKVVGGAANYRP